MWLRHTYGGADECQAVFNETKRPPSPEQAKGQDNPSTQYVDGGPAGIGSSSGNVVEGVDHPV